MVAGFPLGASSGGERKAKYVGYASDPLGSNLLPLFLNWYNSFPYFDYKYPFPQLLYFVFYSP